MTVWDKEIKHQDFSIENIFLRCGEFRIDFGNSPEVGADRSASKCNAWIRGRGLIRREGESSAYFEFRSHFEFGERDLYSHWVSAQDNEYFEFLNSQQPEIYTAVSKASKEFLVSNELMAQRFVRALDSFDSAPDCGDYDFTKARDIFGEVFKPKADETVS
jgi:hypothetical protein